MEVKAPSYSRVVTGWVIVSRMRYRQNKHLNMIAHVIDILHVTTHPAISLSELFSSEPKTEGDELMNTSAQV